MRVLPLDLKTQFDRFAHSFQQFWNGAGVRMTASKIRHLGNIGTCFVSFNEDCIRVLTHAFVSEQKLLSPLGPRPPTCRISWWSPTGRAPACAALCAAGRQKAAKAQQVTRTPLAPLRAFPFFLS